MPKLPVVAGDECLKALVRAGFVVSRRVGSHVTLARDAVHVTVPCHAGKDLKPGILRAIIRQAGMTVEEFRANR